MRSKVSLNRLEQSLKPLRASMPTRNLADYIKDYEQNQYVSAQKHQEKQARLVQPLYLFKKEITPRNGGMKSMASLQRLNKYEESQRSRSNFPGEAQPEQNLRYDINYHRNDQRHGAAYLKSMDFSSQLKSKQASKSKLTTLPEIHHPR